MIRLRPSLYTSLQRKPMPRLRLTQGKVDARLYYLSLALTGISILLRQPLLFVGGIVFLFTLCIIDIWVRCCLYNVYYQRSFSEQQALFGEEITVSLSIENAKLLPLPWLELDDTVPRNLIVQGQPVRSGLTSNRVWLESLFTLRWYQRVTRRYTVRCTSRGLHSFGPTILRSGDVFGFVTREMHIDNVQHILVYPLVVPLSSFHLPARHPFGEQRAPRRLLEDPSRVIGVRDYVYGDSLRRINWKATARTMHMQSKIYDATTTYTLEIFLNTVTHLDTHYGIHPELQELSICAAASISSWAIDQGYSVGLYSNTIMALSDGETSQPSLQAQPLEITLAQQQKRRRIRLLPSSSEEQRKRIMEVLARIQGYFGSNIEELLHAERTHLPAGSTVIVITTAISENMIEILTRMHQNGHAVTILFAGDAPPPLKLAGIPIHYLGGETTWTTIQSTYLAHKQIDAAHTFHL